MSPRTSVLDTGPADEILDALGERTRRIILQRLGNGPLSVAEIARGLAVSRSAVSQHLKVLKDVGLVNDRPQGTRRIYSVDTAGLDELRHYLEIFWPVALGRFAAFAEQVRKESPSRRSLAGRSAAKKGTK